MGLTETFNCKLHASYIIFFIRKQDFIDYKNGKEPKYMGFYYINGIILYTGLNKQDDSSTLPGSHRQ